MGLTPELEAEIIRLFHAEGWRKTTIARQFNLHHTTVTRVLNRQMAPRPLRAKTSKVDPYLPLIKKTLDEFPKLNATRLFAMVKQRGYNGGVDHFRDIVRNLRPTPKAEAYLRLDTLPGEEAQVDWGSFGKITIGNAERRLLAFVMVLSYSRKIFLRFYLGDETANFLRGHIEAFEYFGAVPRRILYDNLKTAVIERVDSAIRFNSELLKLAGHYRFSPQPVPVARPTSKGKVERAIRYVRSSFFAAREFAGLDDLNDQARAWCNNEADERKWPKDKNASVRQAFQHELPAMLALPDDAYAAYDRKLVRAGKTPYVRFDGNDYSIPHQAVRQNLLVEATLTQVRVLDGINVVAEHARSFDKGTVIEKAEHIDALVKEKRNPESSRNRGMNRIQNVAPSARKFFEHAARRGHNMGRLTQLLIDYLELYGSAELEAALAACLANGRIHSDAVRTVLEQRREAQGLAPPVRMRFLKDRRIQDINIRPKSLDAYDRLLYSQENEE